MDFLTYSILLYDKDTKTYNVLYEDTNLYYIINAYSYLTKKFNDKCIKVCKDLQIYNGVSYEL